MEMRFKGCSVQAHDSWAGLMDARTRGMLKEIEKNVENITPPPERALHFLSTDLHGVRCVILGQDPYPQEGVATGRAFEVGGVNDWGDSRLNTSLKNILKLLHKTRFGLPRAAGVNEVRRDVESGRFFILPPDRLFKHWENEGVLLINTALTCETGKPFSHGLIWQEFSRTLVKYIDSKRKEACWFLWGNFAQGYSVYIRNGRVIRSAHPRLNSHGPGAFLATDCFSGTGNIIDWYGSNGITVEKKYEAGSLIQARLF